VNPTWQWGSTPPGSTSCPAASTSVTPVLPGGGFRSGAHGLLTVADQTSVLAFLARVTGARQLLLVLPVKTKKPPEKYFSSEAFGEVLDEHPARLVFLFLGGFLLGCHELYPPFERFLSPKVLDKAP